MTNPSNELRDAPSDERPVDGLDARPDDGRRDFDFSFGTWSVRNERLVERLVGCQEWETFEAEQQCRPLLGGLGNLDDFVTQWRGGYQGMTLRLFQPATRQWSIYWASNRDGVLDAPVVGRFEGGVGTFYGPEQHQGTPVLARFVWSHITATGARWEQAFSTDDGKTWELNWRMTMTRIGGAEAVGTASGRGGPGRPARPGRAARQDAQEGS